MRRRVPEERWSAPFETYMRNRLLMGAFRYGLMGAPGKTYQKMPSIRRRVLRYGEDGNQELLVDAANLAMVEYVEPSLKDPLPWEGTVTVPLGVASVVEAMDRYEGTGNRAWLVEIACLCMDEFVEPRHPKPYWKAEDDGDHVEPGR